ncbi:Crp/Fnr family transcriptional regulator [Actinomadura sp. 6N118]|uniref:Crp/Fnr family transcriptional regulator n=1 Tax=Actinomadura sp. 6N118 TaxID=3375151 RepID=UPI0037ABB1DA
MRGSVLHAARSVLGHLGPSGALLLVLVQVLVLVQAGRSDPLAMAVLVCAAAFLARSDWTRVLAGARDGRALAESAYQVYGPHALASGSFGPGFPIMEPARPDEPRVPATFWESLSVVEQKELEEGATPRTFALGATLFREGEHADFVLIIRSGRTKIYVTEKGHERLLAERGPGQLIGERAALRVNVRSATVVALDTVEALMLSTLDFANFISRHPHVLKIVESQIYNRLTEGPGQSGNGCSEGGSETHRPADPGEDDRGGGPGFPHVDGHHCTILRTDIVGFASNKRTADDRLFIQDMHLRMTRESFRRAGILWDSCYLRPIGDELLVVAPPSIATTRVIEALGVLYTVLKAYHRRSAPAVQVRLRAAVHVGPLTTNDGEPGGDPLIHSARLLDAGVLRRSMAETEALLGVLASTYVYENVIKNMDADGYRQVRARVKETQLVAWMRLSGPALTQ